MRTFRADLIRAAFEDRWPPFSTEEERRAWYDRRDETPGAAEMRRAYELGTVHRERGLTADEKGELDSLADSDGWFARWENDEILEHLHDALSATQKRVKERKSRGVLYDTEKP